MMTVVVGSEEVCFDSSKLKTYLYMRGFGPDAVSAVTPARVLLFDFFCYGVQLYVLWILIPVLSPYCILI